MVDFDDDFGELGVAHGKRQRLPGGIAARVARRRLAPRQPEFAVLDGDSIGRNRLGQSRKPGR